MGEVFAGRYELVDPLASGGGGVIWRVWDKKTEDYRAGKVLKQSHSDSLIRFMRETSWRVEHPHVITPLGWAGEDEKVIFTMDLIHGGSLAQLIKEQGALPPDYAVAITHQLLDALDAVHERGIVHRDIKPANVLLAPDPDGDKPFIYLSDFGIAAPVGDPRMTRATEVIGTPGYMSPEAQYGADPTPAQDLYALGVVLLEMLTGQQPPSDGPIEIPSAARSVPLGQFIARLLDEETRRYQTCGEAREALSSTPLPAAASRPIPIPDRIPALPEGWTASGPISGQRRTTSVNTIANFPMQPPAVPQHRPEAGWGGVTNTGSSAPVGRPTMPPPTGRPMSLAQSAQRAGQPVQRPAQRVQPARAADGRPIPGGVLGVLAKWPEPVGWFLVLAGALLSVMALVMLGR